MPLSILECPRCGGPLSLSARDRVRCGYCGRTVVREPDAHGAGEEAFWGTIMAAREEDDPLDTRRWCRVGGQKFLVGRRLGLGTSSEVFFAERAQHPTELVVLKVAAADGPKDPFEHEWELLSRLAESTDARAPRMTELLPQLVVKGTMRSRALPERPVLVTRWRSGYLHTVADVRVAYPGGIDARTVVWVWRRALTLLGWLHARGVVHGALRPEHLMLHPRDHGLTFLGWSSAAVTTHPEARAQDLIELARSVRVVLAGTFPRPLEALLLRAIHGDGDDPDALCDAVKRAARAVWGPPAYHPFTMPGWNSS